MMKQKTSIEYICCDQLSLIYYPHFFNHNLANQYLAILTSDIEWQQEYYTIYGKKVKAPRLMAWYGDRDASYQYSGITHQPCPWIKPLVAIRKLLEDNCHCQFNSTLANLYRNGQDSMGWHADKEPELGNQPIIASVSFGAERQFSLRHNQHKSTLKLSLQHGSLLIMQAQTQHYWKHAVLKTKQVNTPRINLTYRKILSLEKSLEK